MSAQFSPIGYDGAVTRVVRLATASLLAFVLTTVPLVADWCAISCEAAHSAATNTEPSCHHLNATMPRMADVPAPCGHDHHPVVVDASTTTAIASSATVVVSSPVGNLAPAILIPMSVGGDLTLSPPLPLALASTLRV